MKNKLKKYIVDKNIDLLSTMRIIDENGQGMALVCTNNKLEGIVTDGDIRRYLLREKTIKGTIKEVMNNNPIFAYEFDNINAFNVMKKKHIRVLPILDENKNVTDIIFLNDDISYKKKKLNLPVVVMAGGKGTRLYPYTQILPKPLILINDKTIIELIMEKFEDFGCNNFFMIVNYKKEFIKAFFNEKEHKKNITFIDEPNFLGTAGGLRLLKNKIKSTFFMSNCDILINTDYSEIIKYHKENNKIITMVCALKKSVFPYGTIETDNNGNLLRLKEKPTFEFLTNTGLYVIEPEFLDLIPENQFIHITDVIQSCIDKNIDVGVYPISEDSWMDMGQLEDLEKMRKAFNQNN